MSSLLHLGRPALVALADALESGRLAAPYTTSSVGRYASLADRETASSELQRLADLGMAPAHIAATMRMLADERSTAQAIGDRVDLVWSGPETTGARSRATSTVVREMFSTAERTVLVASYALDTGTKADALFAPLVQRMAERPQLSVRLFVNVHRPWKSKQTESELLRNFADRFRKEVWPTRPRPRVFHDPRALEVGYKERACLHAKCVIIDDERAFITSANFTEAAHERNMEAGMDVRVPTVAKALRRQFDTLVKSGMLVRVPGID